MSNQNSPSQQWKLALNSIILIPNEHENKIESKAPMAYPGLGGQSCKLRIYMQIIYYILLRYAITILFRGGGGGQAPSPRYAYVEHNNLQCR